MHEIEEKEYLAMVGLFTKEELRILSNAMLNLIRSTNVTLTMTYDPPSISFLKIANNQYQKLNKKICEMIGDDDD